MIYQNVKLHNVAELMTDDRPGVVFSRVPNRVRERLNENARKRALNGAGVELRFNLKGDEAVITLQTESAERIPPKGVAEIFYGDFQGHYEVTPCLVRPEPTRLVVRRPPEQPMELAKRLHAEGGLRFDPALVRVLLPQDTAVRILDIQGDVAPPEEGQEPATRCLAYGSSITFGGDSAIPSGGYAARTAKLLGADLINLGMAGGCHLEPEMADYIAERTDWDFATLELGINVVGFMEAEEFERRVRYMLEQVAGRNRGKWVFCIDLFTFHRDGEDDDKVRQFREIVRTNVKSLKLPRLVHVSGRELLPDFTDLCIDMLHPSTEGMAVIAANLAARMSERMRSRGGRMT